MVRDDNTLFYYHLPQPPPPLLQSPSLTTLFIYSFIRLFVFNPHTAEWCGPCKMMVPVLEQLAASMEGEAMIAKVDTDKSPKLASRFSIEALPTLILFYKGKPVETFQGYLPADQLEVKVRQVISRIKQAGV